MKLRLLFLSLISLSLAADVIVPVGSAKWNTWTTPLSNRSAGFWDGASYDGSVCNIGYWLTGTASGCADAVGNLGTPAPGPLAYLSALATNQSPVQFSVSPSSLDTRVMRLHLKVTAYNDFNEFGYYLLSAPNVLNPLFLGSHTAGSAAGMQPTGPFAFYLKNGAGKMFTSQSSYNFAVFTQTPALPATVGTDLTKYYIAVEDLPVPTPPFTTPGVAGTDADYNDLVVDMELPPSDPPTGSGCTLTQGGYKNRFNFKVVQSAGVVVGARTYTPAEINSVLGESVRGNGLVSLAHQLITAKLNIYYGAAAPGQVLTAIQQADLLIGALVVPPVGTGYLLPSQTSSLTSTLDAFNNGKLGPKHCQ